MIGLLIDLWAWCVAHPPTSGRALGAQAGDPDPSLAHAAGISGHR